MPNCRLAILAVTAFAGLTGPAAAGDICSHTIREIAQRAALGHIRYATVAHAMLPTLMIGDVFPAEPVDHAEEPLQRGEVIAFCIRKDNATVYVMRVVGLPGDKVRMEANRLYVNGAEVVREPAGSVKNENLSPSKDLACFRETLGARRYRVCIDPKGTPLSSFEEVTVPEASLFVLGDNRDNAVDSRVKENGFVALDHVVGRASVKLRGADSTPLDEP